MHTHPPSCAGQGKKPSRLYLDLKTRLRFGRRLAFQTLELRDRNCCEWGGGGGAPPVSLCVSPQGPSPTPEGRWVSGTGMVQGCCSLQLLPGIGYGPWGGRGGGFLGYPPVPCKAHSQAERRVYNQPGFMEKKRNPELFWSLIRNSLLGSQAVSPGISSWGAPQPAAPSPWTAALSLPARGLGRDGDPGLLN